jgi:hypothetical protein
VIRNPNQGSPLNLHYFKVLQKLRLRHERYGVQLCWDPFVKQPAFHILERIRRAQRESEAALTDDLVLPPKPQEPQSTSTFTWLAGPAVNLNQHFGLVNDMRVNVVAEIDAPGHVWDGVNARALLHFDRKRDAHAYIKGTPWREGNKLKATIHVGIDWSLRERRGNATVQLEARFTSTEQKELDAFETYRKELAAWEEEVARRKAEVAARTGAATVSVADRILAKTHPMTELLTRVIHSHFPTQLRDEFWEVEYWHRVFDFSTSAYTLYPGTWQDGPLPFPERRPTDFLNASWARIYLPIQPGYELLALRFIFGSQMDTPLDNARENTISKIVKEIEQYRESEFGGPDGISIDPNSQEVEQSFRTLGKWMETLPTDGTHVEGVLSAFTVLDEASESALTDQARLREAMIQNHEITHAIRDKAREALADVSTTIQVTADGSVR